MKRYAAICPSPTSKISCPEKYDFEFARGGRIENWKTISRDYCYDLAPPFAGHRPNSGHGFDRDRVEILIGGVRRLILCKPVESVHDADAHPFRVTTKISPWAMRFGSELVSIESPE